MSLLGQFIGIDFGTSSSKMAWYNTKAKQAEIIRNDKGAEQTPSVVYLGEEVLVGKEAVEMLDDTEESEYVITSIKRDLEDESGDIVMLGKLWTKGEVVAKILSKLKQDAERLQFHEEVTRAVITYPASFTSVEREVLKQAATLAGFTEVALLAEPVAAALAYTHMQQQAVGEYVLIYDLGAGTFDLAILRREVDGTFSPAMSPMGLKRCGGDDFDYALYTYFDKMALKQLGRHISMTPPLMDRNFLQICRRRKEDISLSRRQYPVQHPLPPDIFKASIDLATFEELIREKVLETVQQTQEFLRKASRNGITVDTLLLVGGSTRIPLVQKLLHENFSDPVPVFWQNSTIAVALGAAYYGDSLWRPENQYRAALKSASSNRRLDEAQVVQLTELATRLGLSRVEQIAFEREVLFSTKETILEKQQAFEHYRIVVEEVWDTKNLDQAKVEGLEKVAKKLGLDAVETARVEHSVLGATKEEVLKQQKAPVKYLAALMATWVDGMLSQEEQADLTRLGEELKLDEQQRTAIERSVMGGTLEAVVRRQLAIQQYRREVRDFWEKKEFSRKRLLHLYQLANQLGLDDSQIDTVENEIMGAIKEGIFAQEYRKGRYKSRSSQTANDEQKIFHFIGNLQVGNADIVALTFSRDGRLLVCCGKDAKIYVWRLQSDDDILVQQNWKSVLSLVIAYNKADDLRDVNIPSAESIRGWYARVSGIPYALSVNLPQVPTVVFSPDGKVLAIAYDDGIIRLWDWDQNKEIAVFKHGKGRVRVLAFSPDGGLLASGGEDALIRLWEWRKSREMPGSPLKSHSQSITSIAFSPNAQFLVSGSFNGGIRLWNLSSKQPVQPSSKHTDGISAISFRADGMLFATASLDHHIHLWDLEGKWVSELTGHTDGINTIVFSPDGLIASGSLRKEMIRLWKPDPEKFLQSITGNAGKISIIAFSPDGEILITSGASRTVNVYERYHY